MKRNAVAWAALVVSSAALVSSSGLVRTMPAAPRVSAESQKAAHALSEAFGAVAEFAKPSVVQISVQRKAGMSRRSTPGRPSPFPFGGPGGRGNIDPKEFEDMLKKFFEQGGHPEKEQFGERAEGTGSGFVYDERGHILTNNHVVEGAGKITVTFYDGVEASAKVVGTDPESDVAVIKVENTSYRPLPCGSSSKVKVGELVMAFGSPFGFEQTVTQGMISATERNHVGINSYESFLQTDAPINPGNSGGPLVNMDGQVIGINSAIVTGSRGMGSGGNDGVGFAVPIDMATHVADKLIKDGKVSRARVGIVLNPLTPAFAKQFGLDPKTKGVVVGDVLPGSPADKSGLKSGDIITEFNGGPVTSMPAFRLNVSASDAGKSYKITYFREGKEHSTNITPAPAENVVFDVERKGETERPAEKKAEPTKVEVKDFGLEVQALTPELATSLGMKKDLQGILVSSVKEGSEAEAAGLTEGMAITKVIKDKKVVTIKSVKDFQALTANADELAIYVESGKGPGQFVTLSKAKKE